jgi:hypothetical protein
MKKKIVLAVLAVALVLGMTAIGCSNSTTAGDVGDTSVLYRSADANNSYDLEIIKSGAKAAYSPRGGDDYTMTVTSMSDGSSKKSDGKVKTFSGGKFTLEKDGNSFEVTIADGAMTAITGAIPLNDGTTIPSPGAVTKLGTFTLTGIPAQYNGWEAAIDYNGEISNFGLFSLIISGGKVVIPLFDSRSGSRVGYSGNDTIVDFEVLLGPPAALSWEKVLRLTVQFSNGSVVKAWSDGVVADF